MKIQIQCLLLSLLTLVTTEALADIFQVNCSNGDSLAATSTSLVPGDTVEVAGTCNEAVIINTDGITLDGGGDAVIDAGGAIALTIDGVQRVVVEGLRIRNGFIGVLGKGGASFALTDIIVRDNAFAGIQLEGNSSLAIADSVLRNNGAFGINVDRASELHGSGSLTVNDNGVFGIILGNNSSAAFSNADVKVKGNILGIQVGINSSFLIADSASKVTVSKNLTTGLTVVSGSTLFVFEGSIVANNNRLNHGVSANSNSNIDLDRGGSITARNNGQDGIQLENSLLNMFNMPGLSASTVISRGNGRHGIGAFTESVIDLSGDSVITSRENGADGVLVDNGSTARIINSTIRKNAVADIELSFGARGDFSGNANIGSIVCDSSVLIRGDTGVTCPVP